MLSMLFTHFADRRPISTFTPLFSCLLPLLDMCQNSLGFLPCFPGGGGISLGNIPHSWQLESCWCNWNQPPSVWFQYPSPFRCWLTTCSLERSQDLSCGLSTLLKSFAELALSFMVIRHALNAHVECLTKGRKVCFPLRGPQYGSEARFFCGRILGSLLVKRSSFLSQQARRGKCPLIQGGSCQNKHTGDSVSQLIFSLLFLHCLFPTSPSEAFPELYMPAATQTLLFQTQNIYEVDEWENMTDRFKTWRFVIMAVWNPVLHF